MSKEQDLLFCKIAISSGLVTQEIAQKALALANRFEAEGKPRPQVGVIFIKQNILAAEDAQRIYGAVQKRLQAQGGPAATAVRQHVAQAAPRRVAAAAAPAGRATAAPRRGTPVGRGVRARRAPAEKIDPITLWSGIGFGVVVIGCIVAMLIMLSSGDETPEDVQGGLLDKGGGVEAPAPKAPAPVSEVTPARQAGGRDAMRNEQLKNLLNPNEKKAPPSPAPEPEPEPKSPKIGEDFGTGIE